MLSAIGSDLVAGSSPTDMATTPKTIKVRVLRAFFWNGKAQKVGAVLDYPEVHALEAITYGKAERVADAPAPAPKPKAAEPDKVKDDTK